VVKNIFIGIEQLVIAQIDVADRGSDESPETGKTHLDSARRPTVT
jgi:hypothetical protein